MGEKDQNGAFLGCFYTSSKSKFRSKGAEFFWAPPILYLNCAYGHAYANQRPSDYKAAEYEQKVQ